MMQTCFHTETQRFSWCQLCHHIDDNLQCYPWWQSWHHDDLWGSVTSYCLTHKQLEIHRCILSTVATDALVLKHLAISIHSADWIFIVMDQFLTKMLHLEWARGMEIKLFWKKNKANLRDLIAATCLVILLKLGSNHRFFSRVTLKSDGWPRKTGHLFYDTLSFSHHFLAIGEFKLELQSGNA